MCRPAVHCASMPVLCVFVNAGVDASPFFIYSVSRIVHHALFIIQKGVYTPRRACMKDLLTLKHEACNFLSTREHGKRSEKT